MPFSKLSLTVKFLNRLSAFNKIYTSEVWVALWNCSSHTKCHTWKLISFLAWVKRSFWLCQTSAKRVFCSTSTKNWPAETLHAKLFAPACFFACYLLAKLIQVWVSTIRFNWLKCERFESPLVGRWPLDQDGQAGQNLRTSHLFETSTETGLILFHLKCGCCVKRFKLRMILSKGPVSFLYFNLR